MLVQWAISPNTTTTTSNSLHTINLPATPHPKSLEVHTLPEQPCLKIRLSKGPHRSDQASPRRSSRDVTGRPAPAHCFPPTTTAPADPFSTDGVHPTRHTPWSRQDSTNKKSRFLRPPYASQMRHGLRKRKVSNARNGREHSALNSSPGDYP